MLIIFKIAAAFTKLRKSKDEFSFTLLQVGNILRILKILCTKCLSHEEFIFNTLKKNFKYSKQL